MGSSFTSTDIWRDRCACRLATGEQRANRPPRFGSWASSCLCNLVHGTRLADFNSAFQLVWGPALRKLDLEVKGLNYSTEMTSRLLERRIVPVAVAIEHRPRVTGTSSMKLVRGALHRFLFVAYIAMRQLLLRLGVLRRPLP